MLKHLNYLDEMLEFEHIQQCGQVRLTVVASELMEHLGYSDNSDFNSALIRSMEVCTALHIPIRQNFKKIYKFRDHDWVVDWQLSDLAAYLITINGNTCNPNVARAQLQFISGFKKSKR